MRFLGQKKTYTISLLILSALLSTAGQASTCKKANAMRGNWDVHLDVPLTVNVTALQDGYTLADALANQQNFARLSLYGQFTFNNKSMLTKGTFRDHQFDWADEVGLLNYSSSPRGLRLDISSRFTQNKQKVTNWKKANKKCYGDARFFLKGLDKVDGNNVLVPASICYVKYRLDRNAHNAHLHGSCDVQIYDPMQGKELVTLGILSGSMIKKY